MHISFISPEANRTGAPFSLVTIASWLHEHAHISCSFIVQRTGPLIADMQKIGEVFLLSDIQQQPHLRKKILAKTSLIYANMVASYQSLDALSPFTIPIIAHIHELEYAIEVLRGNNLFHRYPHASYIAASDAVRENLIHHHGIQEQYVRTIYEAIKITAPTNTSSTRVALRKKLNIAPSDFIIGSCGSIEWRKGPDLFLATASEVRNILPKESVKFIWIGAAFTQAYMDEILYEQEKRGLAHSVHFIGPRINPLDYFKVFDTFFLPSREDPFPLVMLMAAQHKLPIVCFDNAGGAPEFVQKDAGYSVPFGDTNAAAEAIKKLYFNATDRTLRGMSAHNRLISNHDISVVGPQILATINNTLQTTL